MTSELTEFDRRVMEQLKDWYQDEKDKVAPLATVSMGPFTAFVAIGALQLAWRHPDMSELNREILQDLGRQMQVLFAGEMADALEKGWDISLDREPLP